METCNKNDICFLILHYGKIKLTYNAIKSILSLETKYNIEIVVVDNSQNFIPPSFYSKVHILKTTQNVGFSKGNNIGFEYIKKHFNPIFLFVVNSDILFVDNNTLLKVEEEYFKRPFYVAGPDVYVPKMSYHSSPLMKEPFTSEEIISQMHRIESEIDYYKKPRFKSFIYYIISKYFWIFDIRRALNRKHNVAGWNKEQDGVVLQGSCLIFDSRFIDKKTKIFDPETFLYLEESILTLCCKLNGWTIRYLPQITVHHLESVSSRIKTSSYKKYLKKMEKHNEMQIETRNIYLDYLRSIK